MDSAVHHIYSIDPATLSFLREWLNSTKQPQWATNVMASLQRIEAKMATISDQVAAVKAELDGTKADLTTITTGVQALRDQVTGLNTTIQSLQDQLTNLGVSPEVKAAINGLVTEGLEVQQSADALAGGFQAPPPTT